MVLQVEVGSRERIDKARINRCARPIDQGKAIAPSRPFDQGLGQDHRCRHYSSTPTGSGLACGRKPRATPLPLRKPPTVPLDERNPPLMGMGRMIGGTAL